MAQQWVGRPGSAQPAMQFGQGPAGSDVDQVDVAVIKRLVQDG
jgi:hypothetical protein